MVRRGEISVDGTVAMMELLVESGADVNATDDAGNTPLQVAVHPECVECLRSHGGT